MKGYKSNIEELNALVEKMDNGELSIEELSTLEKITRELHERSIILRYKAFENKVNPEPVVSLEEDLPEVEEVREFEPEEQDIDFSIFDEGSIQEDIVEEEPSIEENKLEPEEEPVEPIIETPPVIEDEVEAEQEGVIKKPVKETPSASSFMDNSIAAQFSGGKLDSLIGAFGINQRLGFINNLFDGSSDAFSDALKELDNQDSIDSANMKISSLSATFEWENDDEDVIEFVSYVNRRYAE